MQNDRYYVYCFINKDWNNSVFYVGKGTGNRCNSFSGRSKHIKAIFENNNCESKILFRDLSEEDAIKKEKHLKETFKMIGYPIIDGEASVIRAMAQRDGISKAIENGVKFGRPPIDFPENWVEIYTAWKQGNITAVQAMGQMQLKKNSFYKLVHKYENSNYRCRDYRQKQAQIP